MLQRSIPVIAPTTRTIALSLLVVVALVMTLLVVQLAAAGPAPDPPAPKPPLQFGGGSAGRPMPF